MEVKGLNSLNYLLLNYLPYNTGLHRNILIFGKSTEILVPAQEIQSNVFIYNTTIIRTYRVITVEQRTDEVLQFISEEPSSQQNRGLSISQPQA